MRPRDRIYLSLTVAMAYALMATAGCSPEPPMDPWQATPLEEAAVRCDRQKMKRLLERMRNRDEGPNLRDLHSPDGALAQFLDRCSRVLERPDDLRPNSEIIRTVLDLAGVDAPGFSAFRVQVFVHLGQVKLTLPEALSRVGIPQDFSMVLIGESRQIRVSGDEDSLDTAPISSLNDLVPFSRYFMRESGASSRPPPLLDRRVGRIPLEAGSQPTPFALPESFIGRLQAGDAAEILLKIDPGVSYGRAVDVLDDLAQAASRGLTPGPIALPVDDVVEVVFEIRPPGYYAPSWAVTLKVDRDIPFVDVARVLERLVQGGADRVILLATLELAEGAEIPPGTYPGGMPGGLDLRLRGWRRIEAEAQASARRP